MAEFFRRVEKKYILTKKQYLEIKKNIEEKMIEDFHGKSTICNVYYDSPDFRLIRNSITKPVYKDFRIPKTAVNSIKPRLLLALIKKEC